MPRGVEVIWSGGVAWIGRTISIPCDGVEQCADGVRLLGMTADDGEPVMVKGGYIAGA